MMTWLASGERSRLAPKARSPRIYRHTLPEMLAGVATAVEDRLAIAFDVAQ
jgi:hypothetical protein